ncbi:hypothetical protein [uncultured Mycolicibacterium sp.]|uniref:hypothetical protein n=1 Tax=uncultured Mycolicibacterium sp. TaxID=2320817 RepID=UPI00262D741C|nr:hypothetical protein [uncultured Mycolicibacterium sp.]
MRTAALVIAMLCAVGMFAAGGAMVRGHLAQRAEAQARAEYVAAARQNVVTLLSIDAADPQGSLNRIMENATGRFHDEFEFAAEDFTRLATDAQVSTTARVQAVAVQSMTDDAAVVLVAASTVAGTADGARDAPRSWRLRVNLQREGDRIKMSDVEFVA